MTRSNPSDSGVSLAPRIRVPARCTPGFSRWQRSRPLSWPIPNDLQNVLRRGNTHHGLRTVCRGASRSRQESPHRAQSQGGRHTGGKGHQTPAAG